MRVLEVRAWNWLCLHLSQCTQDRRAASRIPIEKFFTCGSGLDNMAEAVQLDHGHNFGTVQEGGQSPLADRSHNDDLGKMSRCQQMEKFPPGACTDHATVEDHERNIPNKLPRRRNLWVTASVSEPSLRNRRNLRQVESNDVCCS
jgi:hypothetical protein